MIIEISITADQKKYGLNIEIEETALKKDVKGDVSKAKDVILDTISKVAKHLVDQLASVETLVTEEEIEVET